MKNKSIATVILKICNLPQMRVVSLGEGGKTGPVAYKDGSLQIMFMT